MRGNQSPSSTVAAPSVQPTAEARIHQFVPHVYGRSRRAWSTPVSSPPAATTRASESGTPSPAKRSESMKGVPMPMTVARTQGFIDPDQALVTRP